MPQLTRRSTPADDPEFRYKGWPKGYNSYQPRNKIRKDEMSGAQNVEIFQDTVEKRFGAMFIGNEKDSRTRGLALYTHSDATKTIIRSSGTTLQEYNPSTGDYDNVTGKTYTSDLNTDYILAYDKLYIFNGTDNLTKYNKDDSPKITVFTTVAAPTSPSATRGAGLSAGQYTGYFVLTHYNAIGETVASSEFSVTYDLPRASWDAATEKIDLAWTVSAGAVGTNIYFGDTSGDETYIDTVSSTGTAWSFLGGAIEADGITEPPETNSTAGVVGYAGCFDGTRLWCFKGSTAFWSGGGSAHIEHFDSGSGGGAINVAKGDGDEIQAIRRTREGAVIIYKQFSIWKSYFDANGIINLQLVNPLIGAVGKRAVTIVDDDQVVMTRYGVFTLGNQPNFPTDVLRIKSLSVAIDKDLEKVTPTNLANVVLHYDFKRRLRLAYTEGGATYNNKEFIFRNGAWVPNVGFNVNCYLNVIDKTTGSAMLDELNKQYTVFGTDDDGRVVQLDKGYSDMGNPIEGYFDTYEDNQGTPERYKKYYDHDVEIGKLQGTLTITQYFDSGTNVQVTIDNTNLGGMGSEAIGLSQVGLENGVITASSSVSLTKRWQLFGRQQRSQRTRFYQNSSTGTFSIMQYSGVYRLVSSRQYPSADILTVTEV